jgi:DNA-binding NarL/FixJ family response regulator
VLLADQHELMLNAARAVLEAATDDSGERCFTVLATVSNGRAVVPLTERLRPDLLTLDLQLPGLGGLTCLEHLRRRSPRTKVTILSEVDEASRIAAAFSRGACGYILKTIHPCDLAPALRQLILQAVYITPPPDLNATPTERPTVRERLILNYLARGLGNKAIADELYVTEQTIKFHLTNVYRKLGVGNRTQAVREGYRLGLVA